MIEDFLQNVVIIDDNKEEIKNLEKMLNSHDIKFESYTPKELKRNKIKKNRQLIFLDLFISKTATSVIENIAVIRELLKKSLNKNFGAYGIVLWTTHNDSISEFRSKIYNNKIEEKEEYKAPLFVVGLNKSNYLQNDNFDSIFDDLNKEIRKDKAAYFFINWIVSVHKAAEKAITDIYKLVPNYEKQDTELMYLLYKLAQNQVGIPSDQLLQYNKLYVDAYKSFDEMLYSELATIQEKQSLNIFSPIPSNPWANDQERQNEIFSYVNSLLFTDIANVENRIIVPGNVYQILSNNKIEDQPENSLSIVMEITPPCDFSQKKKIHSKIIKGFICNMSDCSSIKMTEHHYKEIFPILWDSKVNQYILFDFRYSNSISNSKLLDKTKYKLLFRANAKLFADILQKYASYSARLGLSILHK